jgi:phenylacetaldehyde dehydrogenase
MLHGWLAPVRAQIRLRQGRRGHGQQGRQDQGRPRPRSLGPTRPLVSKEQHQKVAGCIESGRKEGVKVETGGGVIGNQGYFVEPTVLTKTNRDMRVVKEEIFGPVVCVQSFDDDNLDQVAKFANDTEYGLQASIWTHNLKVAHSLARKIKAGTICVQRP